MRAPEIALEPLTPEEEEFERLPLNLLRLWPQDEAAMEAALTRRAIGWAEVFRLRAEIDRLSRRGAWLIRRHARPAIIERYTEELRLLHFAVEALEL